MATDGDALTIEIRGRIKDFQRALAQAESRVSKMERSVAQDMRRVQQSSRQAAQSVERSFTDASRNVLARLNTLRGGMASIFGSIGATAGTGFLAGVGVGGLVTSINQAASSIAQLRAESDRAGVAFETFQKLQFVSAQQRVSIDALVDGLKELNLRADEFIVTGVGPAAEAFGRLGFSATDLAQRLEDPIELMLEIMKRARELDTAGQIRVFDELFGGTGGEQFVQLMRAGPEALRAGMEEAAIYTDDVADSAAEVDRRFQAVANAIENRVNTNLVLAASAALDVAEAVSQWGAAAGDFLARMSDIVGNAGVFERLNSLFEVGLGDLPEGTRVLADNLQEAESEGSALEQRIQGLVRENEDLRGKVDLVKGLLEDARAVGDEMSILHLLAQWKDLEAQLDRNLNQLATMAGMISNMPPPGIGPLGNGVTLPMGVPSEARAILSRRLSDGNEDISRLTDAAAAGAAAVLSMPQFAGVTVNSGYRSPEHNASIGGAPNSRHMQGDAVDFSGVPEAMLGAFVTALRAQGFRGFGYYGDGNLHADMGRARAWGPDRTAGSLGQTPAAFRNAVAYGPSPATQIGPQNVPPLSPGAQLAHDLWQQDLARQDREFAASQREGARGRATPDQDAAARERQAEAIAKVNEEIRQQLELAGYEAELLGEGLLTREEVAAAVDQEALVRQKLNELEAAGVTVTEEMEAAIRQKIAALFELRAANEEVASSQQRLADQTQALQGAFQAVGQPILDTFMSIMSGSEEASEALKKLALQLANMVLQGALFGSGPLGALFGGGLFGGIFGGARASGGPVSGGTPYLVGERGPELFVPGASGRVIDAASTRAMMARAGTPMMAAGGQGGAMEIRLVSRFDADGGFSTAVERASRPVAVREARTAASEVAARVPEIADARADQRERRRTRPIRPMLPAGA